MPKGKAAAYENTSHLVSPRIGVAWSPERLHGKTVIRTGFSLRKYTEPQQYFWNQATNYGSAYFQQFFLNPNGNTGIAGSFAPGATSRSHSRNSTCATNSGRTQTHFSISLAVKPSPQRPL